MPTPLPHREGLGEGGASTAKRREGLTDWKLVPQQRALVGSQHVCAVFRTQ